MTHGLETEPSCALTHVLRQSLMPPKEHGVDGAAAAVAAAASGAADVMLALDTPAFFIGAVEVADTPPVMPLRSVTTVDMPVARLPIGVAERPGI